MGVSGAVGGDAETGNPGTRVSSVKDGSGRAVSGGQQPPCKGCGAELEDGSFMV